MSGLRIIVASISRATGLSAAVVEELVDDQNHIDKNMCGLNAFPVFAELDNYYEYSEKPLLINALYTNNALLQAILDYLRVPSLPPNMELDERYDPKIVKDIARQACLRNIGDCLDTMKDPVSRKHYYIKTSHK